MTDKMEGLARQIEQNPVEGHSKIGGPNAVSKVLKDLRRSRGTSQKAMAESLRVTQPRISRIERPGEDVQLSTLARYVEALGGRLEVSAVFAPDDRVDLQINEEVDDGQ